MKAEYEVQRTIKRVELTAFVCFLERVIGPIKWITKRRERCRFMDQIQARITWSGRKRHLGGSGTGEGTSYQKGKEKICRSLGSLPPNAMRRLMTWQKQEQC